jgi:hypothetical protein
MSAALGDRSLDRWFWVAVAISLLVSLTPWAQFLLYPFKLFTTWVHESGHAVMTVLVGGRVTSMTIDPDTSGLTQSVVPVGRIGRGLVASSGYLGAAVVGSLLIASIRVQKWAHVILLSVAALMLLTLVFWVRNLFGAAIVLAWSLTLITLARKGVARALRFFLSLLAIQVALNAVYDIRTLFLIDRRQSDAETMARLFLLPSWVWATAWMLLSIAILGATIWMTRKRRRRASPR